MVTCTLLHSTPGPFLPQNSTTSSMTKSYLGFLKLSNDGDITLKSLDFLIDVVTDHQNLQYFSLTKILTLRQAHWSKYLSRFKLVICFHPENLEPNLMHSLDDGTSILKRGIATMPASIHRTTAWYSLLSKLTSSLRATTLYGCWNAPFRHPVSTPRGSISADTPWQSVRPPVDPRSHGLLHHLGSIYVPNSSNLQLMCLQYPHDHPLQVISVRWRPFIKFICQYYWSGLPVLHQGLLQIMHHLFPCQTCAPQTLQTSQATSDSREALEFHIHGFHREAPSIFQLTRF